MESAWNGVACIGAIFRPRDDLGARGSDRSGRRCMRDSDQCLAGFPDSALA